MKQISFSDAEFNSKARVTRRERFLDDMSRVVPFERLQALIEPHYAVKSKGNGNKGGRPARGVALMLRVYGQEQQVHADAGYTGLERREEFIEAKRGGKLRGEIECLIAEKRSKIEARPQGALRDTLKALEHSKANIRAWVEHPFHVVKNLFRHRKLRYKGLAKNAAQLNVLFALANLVLVGRRRGELPVAS